MIIKKAEFIKSFSQSSKLENFEKNEIAIVGRSNVGKSSFINMLANQKKLAKTSSLPGRTRLINMFNFDDRFILVDLPGYGFAKASKEEQSKWGDMIEGYLHKSENLKNVILLVDIRIGPTEKDIQMLEWLYFYNRSVTVVATKADKLSKSACLKQKKMISQKLKIGEDNIFIVSSETGLGKVEILNRLEQFV